MAEVRLNMMKQYGLYETNPFVPLPWCMVHGSLIKSLNLDHGTPTSAFLQSKGKADVGDGTSDRVMNFGG